MGSSWGSKLFTKRGYFMNNGLDLFSYYDTNNANKFGLDKQPRGLISPILTYNKKNPCIRRLSISYSRQSHSQDDDYGLSELTQVILKIFTDFSLYETSITDKRMQFCPQHDEPMVCFEGNKNQKIMFFSYWHSFLSTFTFKDGFDIGLRNKLEAKTQFMRLNNCSFHTIDLVMKKDHIMYGQVDSNRSSANALVVFNDL